MLRRAGGENANPPLCGARYVLDSTNALGGQVGQYRSLRLGDPSIKPERNTEIEGGFDAAFGGQTWTLGVTVDQKTITDLLLEASVAPATGYPTRILHRGRP